MPRFIARQWGSPEGQERATLGSRVADGAGVDERLARSRPMEAVVASETPGPVAVADMVWVRRPVNVHRRKNVLVVDLRKGRDRLID